ncbi:phosphopantetheine-binding protein [Streptomyces sp. NPDC054904]|uniref:phosphopantetheine-binding protein n=1 Tax=unclassified Streptomyces TaxID=2593676 RepID=UPI00364A0CE2
MAHSRTDETANPELPAVLNVIRGLLPDDPGQAWGPEQADLLLADLGFDSLRTVRLLVSVETAMGVELPQELVTAETFRSARTLAEAVHETKLAHG